MKKGKIPVLLGALTLALACPGVWAADHVDGPQASADPAADITDVFAFMTADAQRVILVMDLTRNANTESRFSDSVQYVFHTTSQPSFGAQPSPAVPVICVFDRNQEIECWAGNKSFVRGDASTLAGITSADGRMRVFAGLRNDPFFFNLAGFRETARTVTAAASSLTFDPAGCPALDTATQQTLVSKLQHAPDGGPAVDGFARFNVLAIVVEVDKSVVTKNGPIVSVAGATYRR